jgi:hypothetical protein
MQCEHERGLHLVLQYYHDKFGPPPHPPFWSPPVLIIQKYMDPHACGGDSEGAGARQGVQISCDSTSEPRSLITTTTAPGHKRYSCTRICFYPLPSIALALCYINTHTYLSDYLATKLTLTVSQGARLNAQFDGSFQLVLYDQ